MSRWTWKSLSPPRWANLDRAALQRAWPVAALTIPVLVLAYVAISSVLEATGGVAAVPLDDAYIHFQFAKGFASGEPFVYSPNTLPVAGATSLLWPLLLAVPYALGLREHAIVWAAWTLGFVALALLAHEARRAAERFCSPLCAWGAAALVLAFGANTWFAASGMEVIPLAFLLLRAVRRAAEWCESEDPRGAALRRRRWELLALAGLLPLMRPEGMLGTLSIAVTLVVYPRGGSRGWALLALFGSLLPMGVNWVFTGEASSTTAHAKWLPLSPYSTPSTWLVAFSDYVTLLAGTLLDGRIWSALFLPRGSAVFAFLSLGALLVAGVRRGAFARALLLVALALGILLPATYDCPLCNRLRYLWPFFPAWLVGAAALAQVVGEIAGRRRAELQGLSLVIVGGFAAALGSLLPFSIDDLAISSQAIQRQQVALGQWAQLALPKDARIGVNDAGAITYFSHRETFDVVGLTTRSEAKYWTAGAGSRFEHYERLGARKLPTHFIVYPEWFALDELLGAVLAERSVPGATILGGERMLASVADYTRLGSAEQPDPHLSLGQAVVDRLDVADLESERVHGYQLGQAQQRHNRVFDDDGGRLDGGRAERAEDVFVLDVRKGGALVVRVAAQSALSLIVEVGGQRLHFRIPASRWHEARFDLPPGITSGPSPIVVRSAGPPEQRFASLHYFSLGPLD